MPKKEIVSLLKKYKRYLGYILIIATFYLFYWYINSNPGTLDPLKSTPLVLLPLILVLYLFFLITNYLVTTLTIVISGKNYPKKETLMLTIYSTLVNFFGPLQSGPGFRAIFLKKKIGLSIKSYTRATMIYYVAFLLISLLMMFGIKYPFLSLVLTACVVFLLVWGFYVQKLKLLISDLIKLGLVTTMQLILVAIIYFIELKTTGLNPSLASTLAYTGSANLALFVAFTPGAIGIRESFLLLSQRLHGIPTENIISASLLDRAVYVVFLGGLFIASSVLHLKRKLQVPKI